MAHHAQQTVAELTAAARSQPWAELLQEVDGFNREWAEEQSRSRG